MSIFILPYTCCHWHHNPQWIKHWTQFLFNFFFNQYSGMWDIVKPMDHVNETCRKPWNTPQHEALQGQSDIPCRVHNYSPHPPNSSAQSFGVPTSAEFTTKRNTSLQTPPWLVAKYLMQKQNIKKLKTPMCIISVYCTQVTLCCKHNFMFLDKKERTQNLNKPVIAEEYSRAWNFCKKNRQLNITKFIQTQTGNRTELPNQNKQTRHAPITETE